MKQVALKILLLLSLSTSQALGQKQQESFVASKFNLNRWQITLAQLKSNMTSKETNAATQSSASEKKIKLPKSKYTIQ